MNPIQEMQNTVNWAIGGVCDNLPYCQEITGGADVAKEVQQNHISDITSGLFLLINLFFVMFNIILTLIFNFYIFIMLYEFYILFQGIMKSTVTRKINYVFERNYNMVVMIFAGIAFFISFLLEIFKSTIGVLVNAGKNLIMLKG